MKTRAQRILREKVVIEKLKKKVTCFNVYSGCYATIVRRAVIIRTVSGLQLGKHIPATTVTHSTEKTGGYKKKRTGTLSSVELCKGG
jgi:hypothetical protein